MIRVVRSTCALAAFVMFLGYPAVAQGDPIVISSGVIVGNPSDSSLLIGVQQPGFSFVSTPIGGFLAHIGSCTPCVDAGFIPSSVVDLGAMLDSSGFANGAITGVVDGITYPIAYVAFGSGTFTTLMTTLTDLGESIVDVPFSFSAVMNGYHESPVTRPSDAPPDFTLLLTGSGRASASFIGVTDVASPSGRSFSLGSFMRYDFGQPRPVPEPGTLFLVGGAIGALAARRSLARRRRQG
jgi:hypothetical protein